MVVGWIQSKLGTDGVNAIIELLDAKIQTDITPPVVNPPLPWA
jgi:hypothetical protein